MPWRISSGLLDRRRRMRHAREQATASFLKHPTTGEEENSQADETERAAHLVEKIAEVEPCDRGAEEDGAQVHKSATPFSHSPPDEEDAEGCHQRVRSKVWLAACPCAVCITL